MPIKAMLQAVDGRKYAEVVDPNYFLADIWPCDDRSFPLLQHIDPYGNTVFNGLQMPEVQKGLDILISNASNHEQKAILTEFGT